MKRKENFFISLLFFFMILNTTINAKLDFQLPDSSNVTISCTGLVLGKIPRDNSIEINAVHRNFFLNNNNKPQTESSNNAYKPEWYSMITNLPRDMVSFYYEEITVNKIPVYLGIAVSTAGLILTDNQSWKASDKIYNKSYFNRTASDIFEYVGDGRSQLGLAAGFALFGFIARDNRALTTASEIVESVLASGSVVQVLKHITGRQSPFVSTKPGGAWRFFPNQIDYLKHVPAYDAFPSGHLTTSLAAFVVIAENYPELKWIKPVSYSLEALLAISMVNKGIHWYSDYPLAIFLGYEFGTIIAHHDNSYIIQKHNGKKPELVIGPYFNYGGNGLSVSLEF